MGFWDFKFYSIPFYILSLFLLNKIKLNLTANNLSLYSNAKNIFLSIFFRILVDVDIELDTRLLVAASTVFLSMSFKIITEIIEYVKRNPEIIDIIDRQINEFMVRIYIHTNFNIIKTTKTLNLILQKRYISPN